MPDDDNSAIADAVAMALLASSLRGAMSRNPAIAGFLDDFWRMTQKAGTGYQAAQEVQALVREFHAAPEAVEGLRDLLRRAGAETDAGFVDKARRLFAEPPQSEAAAPPPGGVGMNADNRATRDVHSKVTNTDYGQGNSFAPGSISGRGAFFTNNFGSVGTVNQAETIRNDVGKTKPDSPRQ